ncbi:MAG: LuxR C-terminal-related transcriptional regulator, partial [Corynebacterium matruchotii]
EELFDAIRLVYDGQAVLAPTATAHVLELLKHPNQPAAPTPSPAVAELTPRETVILRLIALGLTNQEIADHEYVSMATVKTHVRHILMKTNSRDRVHAVLFAYRTGVVSTDELLSGGQV